MSGPAAPMPKSLRAHARWERFGDVPVLLVHPDPGSGIPCPGVIWMHGRTVHKELDPGRYLRWMRAGIGACAVDLPGHGERLEPRLHAAEVALDVVMTMLDEIDPLVEALAETDLFDMARLALGGVSAGGMATLARLCRRHPFACASVEAASGSWRHQGHRPMFRDRPAEAAALDPIDHLDGWREIPLQAIHALRDEWVPFEGQLAFVETLRRRYRDPDLIELIRYDRTGAPYEHAGFGRMAADAKNRQLDFFRRRLLAP